MKRWPTTRDPLSDRDAFQQDALASLAQRLPLWEPDQIRQHLMNIAEMGFWAALVSDEPVTKTITLSMQWTAEAPTMGSHCLSNPRFLWGYKSSNSTGSGAPYSHSSHDDWNTEIPAVYWPLANRYDEPLRDGQGLTFWKAVLNHPRMSLQHARGGHYASMMLTIDPAHERTVEPWTDYFAAWMVVRERLGKNQAHERAFLDDFRGPRRWQAPEPWTPTPDDSQRVTVARHRPR